MSLFSAFLLGSVQGITEWLPVSSSAVLFILSPFFSVKDPKNLILIAHLGTSLSLLLWLPLELKKAKLKKDDLVLLAIGSFITILTGALIYFLGLKNLKPQRELYLVVGILLLVTALLNYLSRKTKKQTRLPAYKAGVIVGLLQGIALVPGISRSALTLLGLSLFYTKESSLALLLSFSLALLPTIAGNLFALAESTLRISAFYGMVLLSSFIVGILSIKSILWLSYRLKIEYICILFALFSFLAFGII